MLLLAGVKAVFYASSGPNLNSHNFVTWFEKNPTFLKNSLFQRDKSTPGAGFISNLLSFCLNESQIYCLFLRINEVNMTANLRGVQNIRTINRLGSPAPL